jgi:hypothetical protein
VTTPIRMTMQWSTLLALAALGAGCAQTTPHWDRQYGDSVRATLAAQVIDPAAAQNADPVAGLDGKSALSALQRYQRSGQAEQSQPTALITLGPAR